MYILFGVPLLLLMASPASQAWRISTMTPFFSRQVSERAAGLSKILLAPKSSTAVCATDTSSITSAPTSWDEQGAAGFIPPPIAVVGLLARVGPGGFGGTGPPLKFDEVMQAIDDTYDYTPKPFKNGDVTNPAGTNAGSCKLLSLGILHGLPPASLLALFGEHYRSVIQTPKGSDHGNIRSLLSKGWQAVSFPEGLCLRLKK
ncbi:hypothetical protein NSK_003378 [Nannochloropsis salina CCMP1776]|uniref:HopJ type III effector protein n=1 Tax=Nannochloropsis salina CCMP1776 TaxID=1027361 RepID=A0A4D9D1N1_9STRA|nr:hypothetical protein NSK_003378 [Nannochloropsis salina CCMP1776]|eukprot:TFJ85330.1 hypothetical protein NSK_003378 [Nannochloropsis salina CCMP1776]